AVFVPLLGAFRQQVAELASSGLDANVLKPIQGGFYVAVSDLSPYYHQASRDLIGSAGVRAVDTTCNITSVSMALESLGKTAKDFTHDLARKLLLAAKYAIGVHGGAVRDWTRAELETWRLPNFMQLVPIAINMANDKDETPAHVEWYVKGSVGALVIQ